MLTLSEFFDMDVDSVLNEWTCYKNYILYIIWLDTRNWNR